MLPAIEMIMKGFVLGLSVSVPLGPMGIILINRTLRKGVWSGLSSGMGVAFADTLLAVLAGMGFSYIVGFISEERVAVTLITGLVIIGVGLKTFLNNPVIEFRKREKVNRGTSLLKDFVSLFLMSVSNPFTILIFVAFFSGFKLGGELENGNSPFLLIPGVFFGTITWWFLLSWFISRLKDRIRLRGIVRANIAAGISIMIIGIIIVAGVIYGRIF